MHRWRRPVRRWSLCWPTRNSESCGPVRRGFVFLVLSWRSLPSASQRAHQPGTHLGLIERRECHVVLLRQRPMARLHATCGVVAHGLELPDPADQLERAHMRAIGRVHGHYGGVDGHQLQRACHRAGRYVSEGGVFQSCSSSRVCTARSKAGSAVWVMFHTVPKFTVA